MENPWNIKPPKMLLRLYSLFVLMLDLVALFVGICFAILTTVYRTFRPPPLKSLYGEVALVVGAGRGLGRELAIHLCQLGVTVACVDIDVDNCKTTVQLTAQSLGSAKAYHCDVKDKDDVEDVVHKIGLELGEVTMLFHCCGIPSPTTLTWNEHEIKHTIDLRVLSHFWLLDSVLPVMENVGQGHIVLLSSVAGLSSGSSRKSRVPLSTAQFAVQGLAESLHSEFRHTNSNVKITLIHVYPLIVGPEAERNLRFRIPSYFGTVSATVAAKQILDGVRRNYDEFSVPGYLLYLGHVLRILPKQASFMLRDLLDTGVDFG